MNNSKGSKSQLCSLNIIDVHGNVNGTPLGKELKCITNNLITPIIDTTDMVTAILDTSLLRNDSVYTVFARRDQGNVPYRLKDLIRDLVYGSLNRSTIDIPTEQTIRKLAENITNIPWTPLPVVIEDSSGTNYLVLDGNKRFTALGLAQEEDVPANFTVYAGHASISWGALLTHYGMREFA